MAKRSWILVVAFAVGAFLIADVHCSIVDVEKGEQPAQPETDPETKIPPSIGAVTVQTEATDPHKLGEEDGQDAVTVEQVGEESTSSTEDEDFIVEMTYEELEPSDAGSNTTEAPPSGTRRTRQMRFPLAGRQQCFSDADCSYGQQCQSGRRGSYQASYCIPKSSSSWTPYTVSSVLATVAPETDDSTQIALLTLVMSDLQDSSSDEDSWQLALMLLAFNQESSSSITDDSWQVGLLMLAFQQDALSYAGDVNEFALLLLAMNQGQSQWPDSSVTSVRQVSRIRQ